VNKASEMLPNITDSYDYLNEKNDDLNNNIEELAELERKNQEGIANGMNFIYEAANHVYDLERQAEEYRQELSNFTTPQTRSLEAANAYETITKNIESAKSLAEKGLQTADEVLEMVRLTKETSGSSSKIFYETTDCRRSRQGRGLQGPDPRVVRTLSECPDYD
jgi:cell division septum initiation protein DivIVA